MMFWEAPGGQWGEGLPHLGMWTSPHSLEDRVRPVAWLVSLLAAAEGKWGKEGPSKQSWACSSTACPCASG